MMIFFLKIKYLFVKIVFFFVSDEIEAVYDDGLNNHERRRIEVTKWVPNTN